MLSDTDLRASLGVLDAQFRNAGSALEASFCAKLAVIECCGWTEEAMDDIVRRCYSRCLSIQNNQDSCARAIKSTYGFDYHLHFRKMLGVVIGLTGIERLERMTDTAKIASLQSALTTLKTVRDSHAHTHIKGTIPNLTAPSVVLGQFASIWQGLREIEMRLAQRTW